MSGQFTLLKYIDTVPNAGLLQFGVQADRSDRHAVAVANSQWGRIPGKAEGGMCWYAHGGKEHITEDFWYVIAPPEKIHLTSGNSPPEGALAVGEQTDGTGTWYAAVAFTENGTIVGKSQGGACWYPYGGKEHQTDKFSWLVYRD